MKTWHHLLIRSFFLFALIAVPMSSARAGAKPTVQRDSSLISLIAFSHFKALSPRGQQLYLTGLRELAGDLDQLDQDAHVEYQSAQYRWLESLLPSARAATEKVAKSCVYAGWVSQFDVNDRYCMHPPQGPCKGHQVQCQPLLYGVGKCVASGRSATQSCIKSAKSIGEVAKEVAGHKAEWNQFSQDLREACEKPKSTQIKVCANLRFRLAEMKDVIGDAKIEPTKMGDMIVVKPRTMASTASEQTGAVIAIAEPPASTDSSITETGVSESGIESGIAATETVSASATHVTSSGDLCSTAPSTHVNCRPAYLNQALETGSGSFAGNSVMSLAQAQDLMCDVEPIDENAVAKWTAFIDARLARERRHDPACRSFYYGLYRGFKINLNSCLEAARAARAKGKITMDPGDAGVIRYMSDSTVQIEKDGSVLGTTIGAMAFSEMTVRKLSLCKSTIVNHEVAPPPRSSSRGGGSSGRAE